MLKKMILKQYIEQCQQNTCQLSPAVCQIINYLSFKTVDSCLLKCPHVQVNPNPKDQSTQFLI